MNDVLVVFVVCLEDVFEVFIVILKWFNFLFKYRVRRNVIIVLLKFLVRYFEDVVRCKCFVVLNKIMWLLMFGFIVLVCCVVFLNVLMVMVEWASLGEERITEDNASWEVMEFVYNFVFS